MCGKSVFVAVVVASALVALWGAPTFAVPIAGVDFEDGSGGFDTSPDDLDLTDGITVSSGWSFVNGGGISNDANAQAGRASAPVGKFNGENGGAQPSVGGTPPTNNVHSFSITVPSNLQMDLTDVSFDFSRATGGGDQRWLAFKTSLDANLLYSEIGPARPALTSVTIPLSGSQYENLTDQTVTLQWYAGGPGSGDIDIDSIVIRAGNLRQLPPSLVWYSQLDGNANAAVGGVNGVLQGNTAGTADRAGNPNSALIFDGSGDNVVIDKTTLPTDFSEGSITAWARVDRQANDTGVVGVGGSGGAGIQYFNILLGGGGDNYRADLDRGDGGNDDRIDAQDPDAIDAEWHHLAMTFVTGGGTDALRLYIDGELVNSDNLPSATLVTPTNDWTIGSDRLTSRYFTGAIDDVAIWSTALTAEQIRDLFSGAETPLSLAQGDVIPEPATLSLLGLGALALVRRRRSM